MFKFASTLVLVTALLFSPCTAGRAQTLGPAMSYSELCALASTARDGDVLLVSGDFSAEGQEPLSVPALLHITSDRGPTATVRHLSLRDVSISFSDITLADTLTIEGDSRVELLDGVTVSGAENQSGLIFSGCGSLLISKDCEITGGSNSDGIRIAHQGGNLYVSIEGTARGGEGTIGGAGITVSPLMESGTMYIDGTVRGGEGLAIGGSALNLYNLSGNAYITVDGTLRGGSGPAGGDGIQIVSIDDSVSIGISATVRGGEGVNYGGDALMLMNAEGASSVNLTGSLTGGNATSQRGIPGQSLLIVGNTGLTHTRVVNCLLQDGENTFAYNQEESTEPSVTPLPEITSSVDDVTPMETPSPSDTTATPSPSASPVTPAPSDAPATPSPSPSPVTPSPTTLPTAEPSTDPSPETSASPTVEPSTDPSPETSASPTVEPSTDPTPEVPDTPTPDSSTDPAPESPDVTTPEPSTDPIPEQPDSPVDGSSGGTEAGDALPSVPSGSPSN